MGRCDFPLKFTEKFGQLRLSVRILLLILILLIGLSAVCFAYLNAKLNRIGFADNSTADTDFGTGFSTLKELNVLLLGTDERSEGGGLGDFDSALQDYSRADACMLLHLDFTEHSAQLVSLERSIGVPVEGAPGGEDWLTHAIAYGGAEAMLQAVSNLLDVEVKRYVRVNVGSAAELIDAIGGVDIELTGIEASALNGEIRSNATTRSRVTPGLNHLDGFDAIAYARQRFIDSDFERVQRQRNVLQAAIDQTKSLHLGQLDDLLDTALPLVQTNFTRNEAMALLYRAPGFLGVRLGQMTMPIEGMYGIKPTDDGRTMLMPDPEEAHRILIEFFAGDFDPETYTASDEVQNRVWQNQKQAYYEWSLAHPQTIDSGETPVTDEEETNEEESEEEAYQRELERRANANSD